jgi:GGDEF domain-containing protein
VRVVRECGQPDDFVGHIGGDDFVVITAPERFRDICAGIIAAFDAEIGSFYDPEDYRRGHLFGKNRQGQEVRFPISTISIAVVTNADGTLESPIQIGEIAAELKEYAKSLEGSVYVVDHRRGEAVHGRGAVVPFAKSS